MEVYTQIKEDILDGVYAPGDRLPSLEELMQQYSVSSITIKSSLNLLKQDGLISRKQRQGTIVTSPTTNHLIADDLPLIGVILTNFDNAFGSTLLRSLIQYAEDKAHIITKFSNGDIDTEEKLLLKFTEMKVNGIILLPCSSKYISNTLLELASKNFPITVIDRSLESLPICSVSTNNVEAGKCATEYLFSKNHKNLGIISTDNYVSTTKERLDGFVLAHASHKLYLNPDNILAEIKSVIPNSPSNCVESDIQTIKRFLTTHKDLRAFVVTEYNIALLLTSAAEQLGMSIPDDYSVICFDSPNNPFSAALNYTHISQDQRQLAQSAVDIVLAKINNPKFHKKALIDFSLVEGDSVAPVAFSNI